MHIQYFSLASITDRWNCAGSIPSTVRKMIQELRYKSHFNKDLDFSSSVAVLQAYSRKNPSGRTWVLGRLSDLPPLLLCKKSLNVTFFWVDELIGLERVHVIKKSKKIPIHVNRYDASYVLLI